jgi:enoyl-[acyl-carrier protein] reductase III
LTAQRNSPCIDLSGRVALVTGASRGIGRACARRLAEAGCDVVVNYLNSPEPARRLAEEIQSMGRRAATVKADVTEREDLQAMVEFIQQRFGALDILVSNVASGGFRPLSDAQLSHFRAAMESNVLPTLQLVQCALPLLQGSAFGGRVIAISSHGSQRAMPAYGLIGASKAALESLMRHLALELGPSGVSFNTVMAGLVETDSTRSLPGFETIKELAAAAMLVKDQELTGQDVADAVVFLASPMSAKIQGQVLVVDGGTSLRI